MFTWESLTTAKLLESNSLQLGPQGHGKLKTPVLECKKSARASKAGHQTVVELISTKGAKKEKDTFPKTVNF